MIQATELRMNNKVLFSEDGTIFTVDGVSESGLDVSNEIESTWIEIEQFEPIPITSENLPKCGFDWDICKQAYHKKGFRFVIDFYDTYPNVVGSLSFVNDTHRAGEKLTTLKYVHEIQNLYFALTKEELPTNF